jgi:hypothetical protein
MNFIDDTPKEITKYEDIPESELVTFKRDETEFILKEMCKIVDAPYSEEFFGTPSWYLEYTWTPEEAALFTKWLAALLKRRHKGVGVKKARREAEWFVLNCGWKVSSLESDESDRKVSEANEEAPIIAN